MPAPTAAPTPRRFRRLRRVLKVVALLVAALVVYLVVTAVQVWLTAQRSDPRPAGAIVVMGSAEYDGVPSEDLAARLAEADALWHRHLAPLVVVSGWRQPGDVYTEAEVGAAYLEHRGVPAADVVQVGGTTTWQSMALAAAALGGRGHGRDPVTDVLVVTDGFHEDRCLAIATDLGLTAWPVPAAHSPITGWSLVPYYAKETVGVALGRIIGFSRLDWLHAIA